MSRSRLATGDWVLSIDADERATPALAEEVRRVISDPANPCSGFRVPIRSVILGRPFAFSGTQHDLPLRLFRRDSGAGRAWFTRPSSWRVAAARFGTRWGTYAAERRSVSRQARSLHHAGSQGLAGCGGGSGPAT